MARRVYLSVCGVIFCFVAAAHLTRLIVGWDVAIAGRTVPHWISVPGLFVSGFLGAWGLLLAAKDRSE
jgi:hypothetical protein